MDIIWRRPDPEPWSEGDNIPWNDPDFSRRMLREHLSQNHDAASRRFEKIDLHVKWIHQHALAGNPSRILDLGCGPGLYAARLARLGHRIAGIDYSPASIAYARETAQRENLACTFVEADLRQAEFGRDFDAAMLIFGELNVFRPGDARTILGKACQALRPGGRLILEPHTFEAIQKIGQEPASWFSAPTGLFSERPHIVLFEYSWVQEQQVANIRYYIIEASTGEVIQLAQSMQAYTQRGYEDLLTECGYVEIEFFPSLIGDPDPTQSALLGILARKPT